MGRVFLCAAVLSHGLFIFGADSTLDVRNGDIPNFKTHFQTREYKSKKDWENQRNRLKQQILSAAGLIPTPVKTPLHARVIRHQDFAGYSIESVVIEPLPGYYLGGNLYLPAGHKGRAPGILIPHGHWKRGRLEDQSTYSVPALGINLARQGYVAFAYDMVGYNDTRQTPHSFITPAHALWSFHPMGLQLWNSIRALDYLQSRPEVDGNRLAVTGASGGASQTIFITAVDDRVKASAPVNMVSASMQGGDPCEEAPNLRLGTSNVEIAAMAAPRPMLVVSCTQDWTRRTPVEEFPAIKKIYDLYSRGSQVGNVHIDAEHNYNRQSREAVYRFLAAQFNRGMTAEQWMDQPVEVPADDTMLAFAKGDLPPGTENLDDVFNSWKIAAQMQPERAMPLNELRESLRNVLSVDADPAIESGMDADRISISRVRMHDRVTGRWVPGKGTPVLILDPRGADAALLSDLGLEILHSGRPLLAINPFRPGRERESQQRFDKYFLSYNRTDEAEQVQDILTALTFLRSHNKGKPEVIGIGKMGVPGLFAAAVAPVEVSLISDLQGFSGSDEDFEQRFFVPGIQRVGGLNAAMRLVNSLRATISAPEHRKNLPVAVD